MTVHEDIMDAEPSDAIPPGEGGCVVWQCRQLRTRDHPALAYAAAEYSRLLPVFVLDPSFYGPEGLACDARIQFLHESIADLDAQYRDRGGELTLCHGDPVQVLTAFAEAGWDIVTTADPTGRYGLRRDNAVAEACDVTFIDADGLVRGVADSRDGWADQAEAWLVENADEIRHVLSTLSDLEEWERVLAEIDERVDDNNSLFLRLDKQAAFTGRVELGRGITLRAKVEAYPAKWEKAVENARETFEELAEESERADERTGNTEAIDEREEETA